MFMFEVSFEVFLKFFLKLREVKGSYRSLRSFGKLRDNSIFTMSWGS